MSKYQNFILIVSIFAVVTVSTVTLADEIVSNVASPVVHDGKVPLETPVTPVASHSLLSSESSHPLELANKSVSITTTSATTLAPLIFIPTKPMSSVDQKLVSPIDSTNSAHVASTEKVISDKLVAHPPIIATTNSTSNVTLSAKVDEHDLNSPAHKLCEYLKPICESLDTVQPKTLFKIQAEFKGIVKQTNGKLGQCFLEHYSFDPYLSPIKKEELSTLCSSIHLVSEVKGSYKSFRKCAEKYWDASIDKELDKTIAARINCLKNHNHSKNVTTPVLTHEDEESSLISEVVSKVLEGENNFNNNNSDIKIIDFSSIGSTKAPSSLPITTALPGKGIKGNAALPSSNATNNLLNDPNTVVVFFDDTKTTTIPLAAEKLPAKDLKVTTVPLVGDKSPVKDMKNSTIHIGDEKSLAKDLLKTTMIPSLGAKLTTKVPLVGTTLKPLADLPTIKALLGTTIPPKAAKVDSLVQKLLPLSTIAPVTKLPSSNSTKIHVDSLGSLPTTPKPLAKLTTTKKVEISAKGTKAAVVTSSGTTVKVTKAKSAVLTSTPKPVAKPLETLEEILRRQEKEKQDLEIKLRIEREKIMKQLQKKQDEIDAQNAMKALQYQRAATSDHSSADNRLHQIEHERQMNIDPIGHTIKHQQYEMNKQQKMLNGR